MKDFEIQQGAWSGKRAPMFQVSNEGGVYRRRNGGILHDFGCYGRLAVNTEETRAEMLRRLRKAHPERGARSYATVKETPAIIKAYNAELENRNGR